MKNRSLFIPANAACIASSTTLTATRGRVLRKLVLAATVAMLALSSASASPGRDTAPPTHGLAPITAPLRLVRRRQLFACRRRRRPPRWLRVQHGYGHPQRAGRVLEFGHRDRTLWQFRATRRRHQLRGRHLLAHGHPHRTGRQDGLHIRRRDEKRSGPVFIVRVDHRIERQHDRSFGIGELRGRYVLPFGHSDRFGRGERLSLRSATRVAPGVVTTSASATGTYGHTVTTSGVVTTTGVVTTGGTTVVVAPKPVVVAPPPVYVPPPVVVPAPVVYVAPKPVVVAPPVVYVAPKPVVVAPPVVYAPPPAVYVAPRAVYVAPAPRPAVWVPGHWIGRVWVPAHWA